MGHRVKGSFLIAGMVVMSGLTMAFASRVGRGRVYAMPETGVLAITNTQKNAAWMPVTMTLQCPDVAMRTVSIYRRSGGMEYRVTAVTYEGRDYTYEFDADYWVVVSNVLRATVVPACTGLVEVIYE
jgi:hypothetical protein